MKNEWMGEWMNGWMNDWRRSSGVKWIDDPYGLLTGSGWMITHDWNFEWMDVLIERNKNINRGFRKLTVWKEAIDLYVYVSKKIDRKWFDIYDDKHFSLENKLIAYNKSQIKILNEKGNWNDDYILREDEINYEWSITQSINQPTTKGSPLDLQIYYPYGSINQNTNITNKKVDNQ